MPEISFVGLSPAQLAWLHHEDLLSNACLHMQCVAMTVLVWDCKWQLSSRCSGRARD